MIFVLYVNYCKPKVRAKDAGLPDPACVLTNRISCFAVYDRMEHPTFLKFWDIVIDNSLVSNAIGLKSGRTWKDSITLLI